MSRGEVPGAWLRRALIALASAISICLALSGAMPGAISISVALAVPAPDSTVFRVAAASPVASPVPISSGPAPLHPDTFTSPVSDRVAAELQQALDKARSTYAIPGVEAAVLWPDGRLWTGASGQADVSAHRKVTVDTRFSIGSITKTFTAALILQLADEGALSLDDHVDRWLPAYPGGAELTVRQLLDHTSGLYDFFSNWNLDHALQADKQRFWTPQDVLPYVLPPVFVPGAGWAYSNTNYLLLGLIAEAATGTPYDHLLRDRLLGPLGLSTAGLQGYDAPGDAIAHGYDFASLAKTAVPIDWSDGTAMMPFTAVATAAWSAGGVSATAADLARWGRALYGGSVLSPASVVRMADTSESDRLEPGAAYGLGLQRMSFGARWTWGHSGRLGGFRAAMRYVTDQGVTVVVLTNQDRWDPDRIVRELMDTAMPPVPGPRPTPL
jgi:D-alanyl-D-alanine carboxypeptidase